MSDTVTLTVVDPMLLVADTLASGRRTVRLPLRGTVDVTIDWGDGHQSTVTTSGDAGHSFETDGTYAIRISGHLTQFGGGRLGWGALGITSVGSWGELGLTSLSGAFSGVEHLESVPALLPATVTDTSFMFNEAWAFDGDIGGWDVSNVTTMRAMFAGAESFSGDIGGWDVGSVTDMGYMFADAMRFDQDIGGWDVGSVTDMRYMFGSLFQYGVVFDRDISGWDVGNVTSMQGMFESAVRFDQDLGAWDVGNVTDMSRMFFEAESFDQDIGDWDVSNVTDMTRMFTRALSFDQDLSRWCVARIPEEPVGFATGAESWSSPRPRWGSCPVPERGVKATRSVLHSLLVAL